MKRSHFVLVGALLAKLTSFAQSDVAGLIGHYRQPGYYVGWTPSIIPGQSIPGDLQIRNDFTFPINIGTNNKLFARFTVLNALGGGIPGNGPGSTGDGLLILDQSGGNGGGLQLWCDDNTSGSDGTHIKFDGSFLV
jgi:hypothetical protein